MAACRSTTWTTPAVTASSSHFGVKKLRGVWPVPRGAHSTLVDAGVDLLCARTSLLGLLIRRATVRQRSGSLRQRQGFHLGVLTAAARGGLKPPDLPHHFRRLPRPCNRRSTVGGHSHAFTGDRRRTPVIAPPWHGLGISMPSCAPAPAGRHRPSSVLIGPPERPRLVLASRSAAKSSQVSFHHRRDHWRGSLPARRGDC